MQSQSIIIGRGADSEVRISDISMSRCHSIITIHENGFYLTDNKSKFGTLVRSRDVIKLGDDDLYLQMGRAVYNVSTRNNSKI